MRRLLLVLAVAGCTDSTGASGVPASRGDYEARAVKVVIACAAARTCATSVDEPVADSLGACGPETLKVTETRLSKDAKLAEVDLVCNTSPALLFRVLIKGRGGAAFEKYYVCAPEGCPNPDTVFVPNA